MYAGKRGRGSSATIFGGGSDGVEDDGEPLARRVGPTCDESDCRIEA
jgi:hypothetical protein